MMTKNETTKTIEDYARSRSITVSAFIVSDDNQSAYVLFVGDDLIYKSSSLEQIGAHIDMMAIAARFA